MIYILFLRWLIIADEVIHQCHLYDQVVLLLMIFSIFYDFVLITRHRLNKIFHFTRKIFLLLFRLPSHIVNLVCHKHFPVRQSVLINWAVSDIFDYELEQLIIFSSQLNPLYPSKISIILSFKTFFFVLWIFFINH